MNKRVIKNKYFYKPEAVLDLHGFTKKETEVELFNFFKNAHQEAFQKVKIITGQGWHNVDFQSILKPHVESILDREGYQYKNAKFNDGGAGAIIVKI